MANPVKKRESCCYCGRLRAVEDRCCVHEAILHEMEVAICSDHRARHSSGRERERHMLAVFTAFKELQQLLARAAPGAAPRRLRARRSDDPLMDRVLKALREP